MFNMKYLEMDEEFKITCKANQLVGKTLFCNSSFFIRNS